MVRPSQYATLKMPTQIQMVPIPMPTANARMIHRRCWGTSSRRIARNASTRQATNQAPKTSAALASSQPPQNGAARNPGQAAERCSAPHSHLTSACP
jgi:hypothetical protein